MHVFGGRRLHGRFRLRRTSRRVCRHRARRLLPAARIEHRGVPSDRVVADPRSPVRGGVRDLRRSAAHSDRARRGSAPAGAPGQRPGPARLDARGDRSRGAPGRAVHRAAHERLRSDDCGRARMDPGTSRRGLWRAGRADRRGGAALRRRTGCARTVVDGRQSVDRRDAQESRADQPLPGDGQSRPPRLRAAVPDRAAKRDGRTRDGRARTATARLPQRRRRSRPQGDGRSLADPGVSARDLREAGAERGGAVRSRRRGKRQGTLDRGDEPGCIDARHRAGARRAGARRAGRGPGRPSPD